MKTIREMIRIASESVWNEKGNSPGGLGLGVAEEGHTGPTTPDRPSRAVGNTACPASGVQAGPGALCRVIGYLPPSRRLSKPSCRVGGMYRG